MPSREVIGVDLDGTLAYYDGWQGEGHVGAPIRPMVDRVRDWLAEGRDIRIFTARVNVPDAALARRVIAAWSMEQFGLVLPITCRKSFDMVQYWDDRAVPVAHNVGCPLIVPPELPPL